MGKITNKCKLDEIELAAANLSAGNLVAFPTETVYGLGADACNQDAVARIYSAKGRPVNHPLIVHLASLNSINDWVVDVPDYAIALAREFWPGPMTLIMKRSNLAEDFLTGGQISVALRVPDHPVALSLLKAFERNGGSGIAAPSANRFGNVSPTTAQAVIDELGQYLSINDQILDGGQCVVGVESTIIDCTGEKPRILRPGAVTPQMIFESTCIQIEEEQNYNHAKPKTSGSFDRHYAPKAKVILDQAPSPGDGFIALSEVDSPDGVIRVSAPRTSDEFARELYGSLRKADSLNLSTVVVKQPQGEGIEVAIRDRLKRAAFPDESAD